MVHTSSNEYFENNNIFLLTIFLKFFLSEFNFQKEN